MKQIFSAILSILTLNSFAQTDSTKSPLSFSGYIETYYSYDMAAPVDHAKPGFVYSHNRHNEVNINIGFVKANYQTSNTRMNFALMTGTYSNANLAAEPGVLKNIYEGNVGVKISKKNNLWVDAGIFASHIGFESAIGKDCWNLTRSMLADNSPYFESGVKISYTNTSGKWFLSGLVLNGWQRIQRPTGYNTPAFGHQLVFKPNGKITLNSSSFIGSDTPDSTRCMRYFHNFYGQFQITDKLGMITGFDIGFQQVAKGSDNYNSWYAPVLIVKYDPNQKWSIAVRGEYYTDEKGVIINTGTANGFQTYGYSLNLDYHIADNIVWRIEGKGLGSKDKIFVLDSKPDTQNYSFTSALAISF